jgi:hypothetical protein
MALKRCENGHYYDPDKHSTCPSCGVGDLAIRGTRGLTGRRHAAAPPEGSGEVGRTRVAGEAQSQGRAPAATVAVMRKQVGFDPVVGWLVCIEGPEKGRDFRLHGERNFIGRDPTMDICLQGDETVSRHKHAVLSYNPRQHSYRIGPGDGRGMTYLNDQEVDMPMALTAYDIIELGKTRLLFIPLCGERFQWTQSQAMDED